MKLIHWVMTAAFFTASCDLILFFKLGGTVRFAQLLLLLVMVAAIARMIQTRKILWSRGASAMALWCFIQGILISQSLSVMISFQLYLVLLFSVLGIFAILQLYGRSLWLEPLMKVYLLSFVFVGGFGLFQFVSPSLHLGSFLVAQWIRHGEIPRINGFSYEPSYFATYIMMGWIALIDLKVSRARIAAGRGWTFAVLLLTTALIFSTSKTAIIFVVLEGMARLTPAVLRMVRNQANRLRAGSLLVPLPRPRVALRVTAILLASVATLFVASRVVDPSVLLAGTGIGDTAAHSVVDRQAAFNNTVNIIRQHPWVGRSLGGVAASNAVQHGARVTTIEDLRVYWGSPVPVDVYAASGFFGFIPFLWFFLAITIGERTLIRENWSDERAKWLHALIRALVFEWLCLLADNNILRVYFWFHVTMVVVVGYSLRYFKPRQAVDDLVTT